MLQESRSSRLAFHQVLEDHATLECPVIFEANKPVLRDLVKIYPGQVLRIPSQA